MRIPEQDILPKLIPIYKTALTGCDFSNVEEIRIRTGRPLMVYTREGAAYIGRNGKVSRKEEAFLSSREDVAKQLVAFCHGSAYAYQEDLGKSFLTLQGGHRVGVAGTAVKEKGKTITLKDVSGMNIRLAREIPGCAGSVMPILFSKGEVKSTLLVSPPGVGKTTMLREIARQLGSLFPVTMVDERGELAAMSRGVPSFDVGEQTDVLDGYSKSEGILCALRALSPKVMITDEIGSNEDGQAIRESFKCGCAVITSMHGSSITEMTEQKRALMSLFERVILLRRGKRGVEVQAWKKQQDLS